MKLRMVPTMYDPVTVNRTGCSERAHTISVVCSGLVRSSDGGCEVRFLVRLCIIAHLH